MSGRGGAGPARRDVPGRDRFRRPPRDAGQSIPGGGAGQADRAAIVRAAWVPGRREPRHSAEMLTQFLCGETVSVNEVREGWVRCTGWDGYTAWAPAGGLWSVEPQEALRWREEAGARSLGTDVMPVSSGANADAGAGSCAGASANAASDSLLAGRIPNHLPWGSRVVEANGGLVRFPGGGLARPVHPEAIVSAPRRMAEFPPTGPAVLATAGDWCGAPYLWGGRGPLGADCSGFVQAVFELHGIPLPRDSHQQREASLRLVIQAGTEPDLEVGDLLFFAPGGGRVSHVAISGGGARILHSSETLGGVGWTDLARDGAFERMLRDAWVGATRPLRGRGGPSGKGGE